MSPRVLDSAADLLELYAAQHASGADAEHTFMTTSVVGALPSLACRLGVDTNEADRPNREFERMMY